MGQKNLSPTQVSEPDASARDAVGPLADASGFELSAEQKNQSPTRQRGMLNSAQARQLLQQVPVLQPVLLGVQQRLRGVAVLVEVLGEAALAAGEVDEGDLLVGLGVLVPVVLDRRVALQRQPLLDPAPLARVVDQDREG